MNRVFCALLAAFLAISCDRQEASPPSETQSPGPTVEIPTVEIPKGPSCADQIEAWKVQLADYRSQEAQRSSTCQQLAQGQVDLNERYRSLRSYWQFTAPEYEQCYRRATVAERDRCLEGLCGFIALGGYKCSDLEASLQAIEEAQDQLSLDSTRNCCTIRVASEVRRALNLSYPAHQCSVPAPPAAPACASPGQSAAGDVTGM